MNPKKFQTPTTMKRAAVEASLRTYWNQGLELGFTECGEPKIVVNLAGLLSNDNLHMSVAAGSQ